MSDGGANLTGWAAIIAAAGSFLVGLGTAVSAVISALRRTGKRRDEE